MQRSVLICAATKEEIEILSGLKSLKQAGSDLNYRQIKIIPLVTGIGSASTIWSLMNYLKTCPKPDVALNIGIAGSFNRDYEVGKVVIAGTDMFGDLGMEDSESFIPLWEFLRSASDSSIDYLANLKCSNWLLDAGHEHFPVADAITMNTVTGSEKSQIIINGRFNPDIETMEGAAFYYVCLRESIDALALRAISNMVGPRNTNDWEIHTALENLTSGLELYLENLSKLWN